MRDDSVYIHHIAEGIRRIEENSHRGYAARGLIGLLITRKVDSNSRYFIINRIDDLEVLFARSHRPF